MKRATSRHSHDRVKSECNFAIRREACNRRSLGIVKVNIIMDIHAIDGERGSDSTRGIGFASGSLSPLQGTTVVSSARCSGSDQGPREPAKPAGRFRAAGGNNTSAKVENSSLRSAPKVAFAA